ncbi:MAG: zinc ribbon domain-containing protein [Acidobacteria bacterium]|nr:zinc ribbon domain-containing protein [Acidobacteriota bacterium]
MPICNSCGADLSATTRFCVKCGAPRDGAEAARRTYADTLRLWRSRFLPALEHWTKQGRLAAAETLAFPAIIICLIAATSERRPDLRNKAMIGLALAAVALFIGGFRLLLGGGCL